ncbi:MAG: hypothetical protein ACFFD7_06245 [Candidatus Thorarchaeota archaeon]
MNTKELLRLLSNCKNKNCLEEGVTRSNGFIFIFKDLNYSNISYVKSINSSKFCTLTFYRRDIDHHYFERNNIYLNLEGDYEEYYDILIGSKLKTLIPTLQFGGYETLFDVWMFVRTPDGRQFPANFYYGQGGSALGGWREYNDFPTEFKSIVNYNPFDFNNDELGLLVRALETSLERVPISIYYGVYKHDFGNTLMGVRNGPFSKQPFSMQLYGDPKKTDIPKLITSIIL